VEVASAAALHPGIAGILIDMEMYGTVLTYTDAQAFDDTTWNVFMDTLPDGDVKDLLLEQPLQTRLDALVDGGLLRDYLETLGARARAIGERYREAVASIDPDFRIALYLPGYPTAWQYRGLIEGLGTESNPAIVLTYDPYSRPARASDVAGGAHFVHLGGPILGHFPPPELQTALANCLENTDGFWYYSHDELSELAASDPPHGSRADYRAAIAAVP
jgi:hypothetical protein